MVSEDYIFPDKNGFTGSVLDEYLAAGYYRMQHRIFTTHFTFLDNPDFGTPVFWLRTKVAGIRESKAASIIRKKCAAFTISYKKAAITTEVEELYRVYRSRVNFSASASCKEYLHDDDCSNPYDSWMIEIRDGNTLIAAGFFDKGKEAMSGILNFYQPAYNKYSLGKYLLLKKIDYALANHIPYYYTGYISTSITKFDYKLFPDKEAVEVYLPAEKIWTPYSSMGKEMLEGYFLQHIFSNHGT